MKRQLSLILPAMISVVLFAAAFYWYFLPASERIVMTKQREMIRELTNSAWSILRHYHNLQRFADLSQREAQQRSLAQVRALRYGPGGKDYFWISDLRARLVMHPYRQDLEGQDLSNFRDAKGRPLFVAFARVARQKGAGYVNYNWQLRDDPNKVVPKISYVRLFKPWGWVIGTGVYLEDVKADLDRLTLGLYLVALVILLLVCLLVGIVIWRAIRLQRQHRGAEGALQEAMEKYRAVL